MDTKDSNESPMRSLSSFKDEIPGGDFPSKNSDDDDDNAKKSFLQTVQKAVGSAPFHLTMLVLVIAHCLLLTAELCLALTTGGDGSCEAQNCARFQSTIQALAFTCLSVLSFFILEVTLRLCSTGFSLLKKRLELFDVSVVFTTFALDVVLVAFQLHDDHPATRGLGYLILLRCWRFYSIYYTEVKKIHNDLRQDIEMAKYGRRQAEAQADTLQSERDIQLKEIFLLRGFLRQNSMDPDLHMSQYVQSSPYHGYLGTSRTVSIDRAETMREETRLYPAYSTESAISSIADQKYREVYAIQEPVNHQSRESLNASLTNSVFERDTTNNNGSLDTPIHGPPFRRPLPADSDVPSGSEYDELAKEGNDDISQSEHGDHEHEKIDAVGRAGPGSAPRGGRYGVSKGAGEVEGERLKERVEPLSQGVPEDISVMPSAGAEGFPGRPIPSLREGIDNLAYEGDDDDDDTVRSEEQEMKQINQDHFIVPADPSDVLMVEANRQRALSDLNGVTEDVNGVPMTAL